MDDAFLGNIPDIEKISLRIADIRNKIESQTLAVCKTYQQIKETDKTRTLDDIITEARSSYKNVNESFESYSHNKKQLEDVRTTLQKMEQELQKFAEVEKQLQQLQKSAKTIRQYKESSREVDSLLDAIQDKQQRATALNKEAITIMEKLDGISQDDLSEENTEHLQRITYLNREILKYMSEISAAESKLNQDVLIDETQISDLEQHLQQLQEQAEQQTVTSSGKSVADLQESTKKIQTRIDAAEIFFDPIEEAHKNAKICFDGSEKIYGRKTSNEKREAEANCDEFPGTRPKWLSEVKEVRCECIEKDKKFNSTLNRCATRAEFEVSQANCEAFPGTQAQWHEDTQDVRCDCIEPEKKYNNSLGRCISREEFEVAKADCSKWNATAIWDRDNQRAVCDCTGDYQWNNDETTCIKKPQLQVANTRCTKWLHSSPVWNPEKERVECDCVGDYEWNRPDNDKCRIKKKIQLAEFNCDQWPNSVPAWNNQSQRPHCVCKGDYELNDDGNGCSVRKDIQVAEANCSNSPGTHPEWSERHNGVRCVCDNGSWNSSQGRCVSEREEALSRLRCGSCEEPYYDESRREASCVCADGCGYDSTISNYCISKASSLCTLAEWNDRCVCLMGAV